MFGEICLIFRTILFSSAPKFGGSLKTEDVKVQVREKADIKAKLEEARQRRLALENSRYHKIIKHLVLNKKCLFPG